MAISPGLGLLARKGEARPALCGRPLAAGLRDVADLDWADVDPTPLPPVLVERARLAAAFAAAPVLTVAVDADRHHRLDVAATSTGRSAQDFVGEALDMLFAALTGAVRPAPALAHGD